MHPFDEMKEYVGFTARDEPHLQRLWRHVAGRQDEICDLFYAKALSYPSTARVLQDPQQVERLTWTLKQWMRELLEGPWDLAYYERRQRIGAVHVRIGVPHAAMFTAMSVMRQAMLRIARQSVDESEAAVEAVLKITEVDLAVMTDAYREAQESSRLRQLQELIVAHIPETVLLLDGEGYIRAATRPDRLLFGLRDVVGRSYADVVPAAVLRATKLDELIRRALSTRRELVLPRVDVEVDGAALNLALTLIPLDHPEARLLLHFEDLTPAVENEARLRRSESLAQIGALSAAVAHQLRNPLAGISGALQVISESLSGDDRRRGVMDKVVQQVFRLDRLVTDLLTLARQRTARLREVDLIAVAGEVAQVARGAHPDARIEVRGTSPLVAGDAELVGELLLNLTLNACQAVDAGARVLLEVEPGGIVVADDGPGLSQEIRAHLFEPFHTTKPQGTGLGLAIAKRLAEAMGATLSAPRRGPLKGAAFRVEFRGGK